MAFRRGRAKAREQAFFSEKRNRRYKLVNDNIFRPLSEACLNLNKNPNELRLCYDISGMINSFYYKEAREHLMKDLVEELVKPEKLYEDVNCYNEQSDDLIQNIIPKAIMHAFKDIVPIAEKHADYRDNSILFPHVLDLVRRYWLNYTDLELIYKPDGQLYTEEHNAIANIPPESENRIREVIENLKRDATINSILNGTIGTGGLRSTRKELIERAKKLGEYIRDNVVLKIDSEQYLTVCNDCPRNNE
jgi:hypothetical protein